MAGTTISPPVFELFVASSGNGRPGNNSDVADAVTKESEERCGVEITRGIESHWVALVIEYEGVRKGSGNNYGADTFVVEGEGWRNELICSLCGVFEVVRR